MAHSKTSKQHRHLAEGGVFELSYPGKRTEQDILEVIPVPFEPYIHSAFTDTLYFGDNQNALLSLLRNGQKGKIDLIYVDPPYATNGVFESRSQEHAYNDLSTGAAFLESLRGRLIVMRELLSGKGSIYLHIDEKMVFAVKLIMDEVFGSGNFRNCITRKKCNSKNYTRKSYSNVSDYILFYTRGENYTWNIQFDDLSEKSVQEYRYTEPETGRRYMKVPVHAPGIRFGETGDAWRGVLPPTGKHWQYTPSKLEEMDARGEIIWSKNGNPRRKVYLDSRPGVAAQDIWLEFKDAHNQNIEVTGYPTEKNLDLLKRIILASSNPGDLVLDAYAGSGTTGFAARALNRRFILMDRSPLALQTIIRRFKYGAQRMGDFVKKSVNADPPSLFPHESAFEVWVERELQSLADETLNDDLKSLATLR